MLVKRLNYSGFVPILGKKYFTYLFILKSENSRCAIIDSDSIIDAQHRGYGVILCGGELQRKKRDKPVQYHVHIHVGLKKKSGSRNI